MGIYDRSPRNVGRTRSEFALELRGERPNAYVIADVVTPIIIAVLWLFLPFDTSTAGRWVGAATLALVGPADFVLRRRLPGGWSNYGLLILRVAVTLALVAAVEVMWHAGALVVAATAVGALAVESTRRIIAMMTSALVGLTVIALIHDVAYWYLSVAIIAVLVVSHVTWYRQWSAERTDVDLRHDEMVDRARMFSWEVDVKTGIVISVVGNVESVLGYRADELIGNSVSMIVDMGYARESIRRNNWPENEAVVTAFHRDGHQVTLREVRLASNREGVIRGVSVDITELAAATDALRHQAEHDALTGLANRTVVEKYVTKVLGDTKNAPLVLMLADLDRFKEINDTLGHPTGDLVLRVLAARLEAGLEDFDVVARIGGDEFAFVITGDLDRERCLELAEHVHAMATMPIEVDGLRLAVACSIGVAWSPEHGESYADLLKHADIATYEAKRAHGGVRIYESTPDDLSVRRLRLIGDTASALDHGQFELHFQPQVDLATGDILGVEGLARWNHPEFGLLAPGAFFHAIEVAADYHRFSAEMVRQAVDFASAAAAIGRPISVAVNLGSMSFLDQGLPRMVTDLLCTHDVDPSRLTLEVVESDILEDRGAHVAVFGALEEIGVRLSIDDFGTGYSTFSRLRELHVDEVKIDRDFVSGLGQSEEDEIIVRATVELAQLLGHDVVAEGVETHEQLQWLQRFGCGVAQGYLWSPAVHRDTMLEILSSGDAFDVGDGRGSPIDERPAWALDVTVTGHLLDQVTQDPEMAASVERLFTSMRPEIGGCGVVVKDITGRMVTANGAFKHAVGDDLYRTLIGSRDEDFARGPNGAHFAGDRFEITNVGEVGNRTMSVARVDGRNLAAETEARRLDDRDGRKVGTVFILRNRA